MGFVWFCLICCAQPVTVEDKTLGKNGTKTTTKSTDPNNGDQVTTTEFRATPKGPVRLKVTWSKGLDGKYTRVEEWSTPSGTKTCKTTDSFDENQKWVTREITFYNRDGSEFSHRKDNLRNEAGEFDGTMVFEGWQKKNIEEEDEELKKELKSIEEDKVASVFRRTAPCSQGANCRFRTDFFLAYSYLNTSSAGNNESFPLGAHASFIYNVSSHIGLGIDASIHTKTINEVKLTRSFLLGEGKYTFGNTQNCDRTFIPDLHVLAGLGCEKYGMSKGSGFAFGGGVGLDLKVCKNIMVGTQADFIAVKFKGSDALNSNIRASAGLAIRL